MSSSERTGNKYRISPELFSRDLEREREFGISDLRIYGYEAEAGMMRIAGEIFAENGITRELCLRCLVMDQAGDVLADEINEAYGGALVTSLILPELFLTVRLSSSVLTWASAARMHSAAVHRASYRSVIGVAPA